MFATGNFEDRMKIDKCQKQYQHHFFFYSNITSKSYHCLSYHGPATKLVNLYLNTMAQSVHNYDLTIYCDKGIHYCLRTILIEHAEVALHDTFGDLLYWKARRSMRFNKELIDIANDFRKTYLDSTDEKDNTVLPSDWLNEEVFYFLIQIIFY